MSARLLTQELKRFGWNCSRHYPLGSSLYLMCSAHRKSIRRWTWFVQNIGFKLSLVTILCCNWYYLIRIINYHIDKWWIKPLIVCIRLPRNPIDCPLKCTRGHSGVFLWVECMCVCVRLCLLVWRKSTNRTLIKCAATNKNDIFSPTLSPFPTPFCTYEENHQWNLDVEKHEIRAWN